MLFDLCQLTGGIIISVGYLPQLHQIIKTKQVRDINPRFILMVFIGIVLMEIYAVNLVTQHTATMFFITNTISLLLSGSMLVLYHRYR